jgi:hypothetical protein
MTTYKVIRKFYDPDFDDQIIEDGLTLEQAQARCRDKETSSRTCTLEDNVALTKLVGPWFDAYEEE